MGRLPANAGNQMVVIDPAEPTRVYAGGAGGVYRSEDAGETWQAAGAGLPEGGAAALALDPRQPRRLYAATAAGALYLSEDGAATWHAAAGTGGGGGG